MKIANIGAVSFLGEQSESFDRATPCRAASGEREQIELLPLDFFLARNTSWID